MKVLRINKYLLYWVVIVVTFCFTILPTFWYAVTYIKTTGTVRNFVYETKVSGRKTITIWYPIVDFKVGKESFAFFGSDAEHEELNPGDDIEIIYNKHNPKKAFVYTFPGFWGPPLYYFIPLFIVFSGVLLSVGFIPKIIVLKF